MWQADVLQNISIVKQRTCAEAADMSDDPYESPQHQLSLLGRNLLFVQLCDLLWRPLRPNAEEGTPKQGNSILTNCFLTCGFIQLD